MTFVALWPPNKVPKINFFAKRTPRFTMGAVRQHCPKVSWKSAEWFHRYSEKGHFWSYGHLIKCLKYFFSQNVPLGAQWELWGYIVPKFHENRMTGCSTVPFQTNRQTNRQTNKQTDRRRFFTNSTGNAPLTSNTQDTCNMRSSDLNAHAWSHMLTNTCAFSWIAISKSEHNTNMQR